MADIIQIAEKLNSEVTVLNNKRSKMEGMLESAKTNYEKSVKAYEMKYGVKLTEETLQQEFNEVFARTKGAILDLQEKIESIERGDYKKAEEVVEYDLEPDVEPIRAEVKPEPEKKKRGRKPKAVVEAPVETPVVESAPMDVASMEAEEISVAPAFVMPEEETVPQIEDAPFNLDLNFEGFGDKTVISVPEVKEVKETPKKEEPATKVRKPLTAADISAAVAAADSIKQNPITMPTDDDDDDDDEVDLGNMSFGAKPTKGEAPTEVKPDFGFGSFGDLGGFGATPTKTETPKVEDVAPVKDETPSFGGFGDFGGFGGFGGFGDVASSNPPKTSEPADKVEDAIPGDGFSFGGLGDFGVTSEPKKEEKKETITPEGWGVNNGFSGFGDFGSLLNSPDFKFGQ